MFDEQIGWAVDAGVDFVIGETYSHFGEALAGLELIKAAKLPAVITMAILTNGMTREGMDPVEAMKRLEQAGAEVVGLNCARGPRTMMPLLKKIREAVNCHVAALPVPYRTSPEHPTFQSLSDPRVTAFPATSHFQWRSIHSHAIATRLPSSPKKRGASACAISVCAAAPVHTTFGQWPKRLAASRRPVAIRQICRSTMYSAAPLDCAGAIWNSQRSCVETCDTEAEQKMTLPSAGRVREFPDAPAPLRGRFLGDALWPTRGGESS